MINLYPDKLRIICYTQIKFTPQKPYRYFDEGIDFIALNKPVKYKYIAEKHLYTIALNTLFLNLDFSADRFREAVYYVNNVHFRKPLNNGTVNRIIKGLLDKRDNDLLTPTYRKRHLIFNPSVYVTVDEKRKIIGEVCGSKSKINAEMIHEAIEIFLEIDKIPYSKDIAKYLNVTARTIRNHMTPELKEYQKELKEITRPKSGKKKA